MTTDEHLAKAEAFSIKADDRKCRPGERIMYAQLAESHVQLSRVRLTAK